MKEKYQTIKSPSQGTYKDKGSKFLGYAYPAATKDQAKSCVELLKKEHPKARHHCYAFRIGLDDEIFRANDDGEPSGAAGRPILGQIDSKQLTNIIVVVVRYFGGTLLGTGGLVQSYKMSVLDIQPHTIFLAPSQVRSIKVLDICARTWRTFFAKMNISIYL